VTELRRFPLRRLAVWGGLTITLALAGCGIKGPLEPPPSASLTDSKSSETSKKATSSEPRVASVKTEKSRVQQATRPKIITSGTPEEWTKNKEGKARSSKTRGKTEKPDEPFFLDWLL
jgi:predicted small lipoprotein YifL